jgi:hypothetical protein
LFEVKEYVSQEAKVVLRRLFDENQILLSYSNERNLKFLKPEKFNEEYEILKPDEEELLRKEFLSDKNTLTIKYSLVKIDGENECVIH